MCAKKINRQQELGLLQSALAPFHSIGFDTLRLGLPIVYKDYNSMHELLEQLCNMIGATVHKVKYSDPNNPSGKPLITNDKRLQRLFTKVHGRKTISNYFFHAVGAWVIEYKDVSHWIICWKNSKVFSMELYGLSQLDHHKGAVRFELLNDILHYYKMKGMVVEIIGYDFALDIHKPFKEALELLAKPFVNLKTGKPKLKIYNFNKDDDISQTVYFQKYKKSKHVPKRRYIMYDKKLKNTLHDIEHLTRLEVKVKLDKEKRPLVQSYEDLQDTFMEEMKNFFIIDKIQYGKYWDEKARLLSQEQRYMKQYVTTLAHIKTIYSSNSYNMKDSLNYIKLPTTISETLKKYYLSAVA